MNNTNKMLMIAAITSLLVMGTSLAQTQSFAGKDDGDYKKKGDYKKTDDQKSKISASYDESKKKASQHMDQDNLCYRGDDCEQANQGQQIVGKNNDAKGFNDQSKNVEQDNPVKPPVNPPVTPDGTEACEACFRDNLDDAQEITLDAALTAGILIGGITYNSLADICLALDAGTITTAQLTTALAPIFSGSSGIVLVPTIVATIVACITALP